MKGFRDGLIAFAAILLLWQAVVWFTDVQPFILPDPLRVARALYNNRVSLAEHTLATATEVFLGLIIGAVLGAATALLLTVSALARQFLLPIMVFSQSVPVFALAPILVLWIGYGLWSKVAVAVLIIYFPVASTFYDGLRRTDPGLLDLAKVMGAKPSRVLFRLRVMAALPSFASGLRLAAVYAPIGAVIGEWVGASRGLGYLMLLANGRSRIDLVFAALFVLAVFTVLLHAAMGFLANRLSRYAGAAE